MNGHLLASPTLRETAAPVAALLVAVVALAGGRSVRPLLACAAGLGALAGWMVLAPEPLALLHPAGLLARLPGVGLLAVAAGLVSLRGPAWLANVATVAMGGAAGAWLAGAAGRGELDAMLPPVLAGAVLAGAVLAFLVGRRLERPSQPIVAAAVLAGGLLAAGTPMVWPLAAMVVGAAALATLGGAALSPVAVALAGLTVAADLAQGRFRAGFNAVDAACLAPLLALWLLPRIEARIARVNPKRLGPWSAAAVTVAVGVAAVWLAALLRHG